MGNFYQDVLSKDERFNSTDAINDINLLDPVTRAAVEAIIQEARESGLDLMIFETYRSQARQAQLFKNGVAKLNNVGVHHYGLACDLVRNVGGKPSLKGDFSKLGKLARKHHLIWGGDWGKPDAKPKFVDEYHVQRCTVARQKKLFAGTWYPDESYDPTK
jgi:D-alanyl-D-alanine carboxypeptidase